MRYVFQTAPINLRRDSLCELLQTPVHVVFIYRGVLRRERPETHGEREIFISHRDSPLKDISCVYSSEFSTLPVCIILSLTALIIPPSLPQLLCGELSATKWPPNMAQMGAYMAFVTPITKHFETTTGPKRVKYIIVIIPIKYTVPTNS